MTTPEDRQRRVLVQTFTKLSHALAGIRAAFRRGDFGEHDPVEWADRLTPMIREAEEGHKQALHAIFEASLESSSEPELKLVLGEEA